MRNYFFGTIGTVAHIQRGIENHFNISWNELKRKPYEVDCRGLIWRVLIERELDVWDAWQYNPYDDTEDIEMHKFRCGTPEHYHEFRCGYGQKSGQFIFGDIVSVYGHVLTKKHHAN